MDPRCRQLIDSSILARRCAPEAASVEATVRISDLWKWTFDSVEASRAHDDLIDDWAHEKYRDETSMRAKYGLVSAVHEMMTKGFQKGHFALRVHDGHRAWRLPVEALNGWADSGLDLEMTWTTGRLWQFEASDDFRGVADLELPLLTTEPEAAAFRLLVTNHIDAVEARPMEPMPQAEPGELERWVADWSRKARWPIREALLWVALRDIENVGQLVLTSAWGDAHEDIAGAVLARTDLQWQRRWRRVVDDNPEVTLLRALRDGDARAAGMMEGSHKMDPIEPMQWENLEFGVLPKEQRDRSDAYRSSAKVLGQWAGIRWRGYWTGVRIERDALFAAFPECQAETRALTEAEATALIRAACDQNGGFISQDNGAAVVRAADPNFGRSRARELTQSVTGNTKSGPKGPRRIRAG